MVNTGDVSGSYVQPWYNSRQSKQAWKEAVMSEETWYTVDEIAQMLKVHPDTVRSWLRDGRIRGRNFGGRTGYRVRQSALDAFLSDEPEGNAAA
jgi:excisionase family DNA binding protein